MANDIQILKQTELLGQQFSVYGTPEEPLFLAKDVATWIEHTDVSKMVQGVDDDEKLTRTMFVSGQNREVWMLTENGLYEILMLSRKPIAKEFKKGVKKILHEIRTVGGYLATQADDTPEMIMARAVLVAKATIEKKNKQIEEQQKLIAAQDEAIKVQEDRIVQMLPKVSYVDQILKSPSTVEVTTIAQDYGMTARAFNKLLYSLKIQYRVGKRWILYNPHLGKGYVQSATDKMKNSKRDRTYTYTRWTQRGRLFLYEELKRNNILPTIEKCA